MQFKPDAWVVMASRSTIWRERKTRSQDPSRTTRPNIVFLLVCLFTTREFYKEYNRTELSAILCWRGSHGSNFVCSPNLQGAGFSEDTGTE